MNLKRIFPFFIAILALMTSCTEEETVTLLNGIQVSSSYVAISVDGGSTSITLTAKDSWTVENDTEWLTLSSTSGSAGESTLTFSAESTLNGRSSTVSIQSGNETQIINIIQGVSETSTATCAEVIAGPDSKTYRVTGVCTAIANTTYGNWYLQDETGSIYIYGTLDEDGGTKNFLSWGLEVGDEITVEGPKTTYNGTVELVDVTVIEINKSLVTVDSVANAELPAEGGEFIAYLTCDGEGVSVEIPDDASSWLSISSIQTVGTSTVVTFKAEANTEGDRETTLTFSTTDGTTEYTAQTTLSQSGSILDATIAEFIAAEVGSTQYRLTGIITSIKNTTYGNFYIQDFSGNTYVYGLDDFTDSGLKVGDIVTLVGKRGEYNGTVEVLDAVLEEVFSVTSVTIAEVLTKPDDANTYYMVTGEISSITNETYGNLILKDGDSEITVYGCYPGYGATGDDRKYLISDKDIKVGDTLTVIAPKITYTSSSTGVSTIELSPSYYFSHESAE